MIKGQKKGGPKKSLEMALAYTNDDCLIWPFLGKSYPK